MTNHRAFVRASALIFAALGGAAIPSANAASLFDVEQSIQTRDYVRAKTMLFDMEKQGFSHQDVAALLYFSELSSWESRFRQEADAFDKFPNRRTYDLVERAWGMISAPNATMLQEAKVSKELSDDLMARLTDDQDRHAKIRQAFASKAELLDESARGKSIAAEDAARQDAKREASEHDAKIKAQAERRHADLVAYEGLRKYCGGEPGQPRIGMPESKLSRCVPGLHVSQQVNRADGVLSILIGPAYRVDTIGGSVVAWKALW